MKKIIYLFALLAIALTSCSDDDYTIDAEYEKAEITAIVLYNAQAQVASDTVDIDTEQGVITVTLKAGEDKTHLKMTANISAGATLTPGMAQGFQDLTSPKKYTVTSPGRSVVKEWTVVVE